MSAFAIHLAYELAGGIRDKSRFFMSYLFPFGFFVLVGGLMSKLDPTFTGRMTPAMAIFTAMSAFLLSLPPGFVDARESGLLRSFRINGVPTAASLGIPALSAAAHLAVATAIISIVASLAFKAPTPALPALWIVIWAAMAMAHAGLGSLIGVLSPSGRAATLAAQCIYLPSILLGGFMMSATSLPQPLDKLALLFPASHAMRAFMAASSGAWSFKETLSLSALMLGALASFAIAGVLYECDNTNARPPKRKLLALLALAPYAVGLFF